MLPCPAHSRSVLLSLALIVTLGLTSPVPAPAQAQGRKFALLVGVDKYDEGSGLASLSYSEQDVEQLAEVLRKAGYPDDRLRILTVQRGNNVDPRTFLRAGTSRGNSPCWPVTARPRIRCSLPWPGTASRARSGFGTRTGGRWRRKTAFFCPLDADIEDTLSLLSIDRLYDALKQSSAGVKVMLVDACRNNPTTVRAGKIEFRSTPPPPSVAALFSCSDDQVAWEDPKLGGGHGVFFHFVIEGLKGPADALGNGDGTVTLVELASYTQEKVPEFVAVHRGKHQMPRLFGDSGRITLLEIESPAARRTFPNSIGMTLVRIKSGSFFMGSVESAEEVAAAFPGEEADKFRNEHPRHRVVLSRSFLMAAHEVTMGQFRQFVEATGYQTEAEQGAKKNNPTGADDPDDGSDWAHSGHKGITDRHPVTLVSWNDAVAFCRWLSRKENAHTGCPPRPSGSTPVVRGPPPGTGPATTPNHSSMPRTSPTPFVTSTFSPAT